MSEGLYTLAYDKAEGVDHSAVVISRTVGDKIKVVAVLIEEEAEALIKEIEKGELS